MATQLGVSGRVDFGGQPSPVDDVAGWTFDPLHGTTTSAATDGTLYLGQIQTTESKTITKAWFGIGTGAGGATANQNWLAVYDNQGNLLGRADIASAITSGGVREATFESPFFAPTGRYWIAIVTNATTTDPSFVRAGAVSLSLLTVGQSAANYRFAVNGTGLTAPPATITPASNVTTGSFALWAAIG